MSFALALAIALLPPCASAAVASPSLTPAQVQRLFSGVDYYAVWLCPEPALAAALAIPFTCEAAPKDHPSVYYSATHAFWSADHTLHFLGARRDRGDLVFGRDAGTRRWLLHEGEDGVAVGGVELHNDGTRWVLPRHEAQAMLDAEEASWAARAASLP